MKSQIEQSMKFKTFTRFAASALIALVMPIALIGQDDQNCKKEHRRYRFVDVGTLGGPTSINFSESAQEINNAGAVVGFSETSLRNPKYPNFNPMLLGPDPLVWHGFMWQNGTLLDLGALPGAGNNSLLAYVSANGINAGASETGAIDPLTGWPEVNAVIWREGKLINLGGFGGHLSEVNSVNSRGQAAGFYVNLIPDPFSFFGVGTQMRGFLWHNGEMQDLGTLGGPDTFAMFINERGQVAGLSYTNSVPNSTTGIPTVDPFVWEDGRMVDYGTLGGTFGGTNWFNGRGQFAGQSNLAGDQSVHPVLGDHGTLTDLGTLGGPNGNAFRINDRGEIVGEADLPGGQIHHAFLWKRGAMTDLGTVNGDPCSDALQINSREQVVGTSTNCNGLTLHLFLWEKGHIINLNNFLPLASGITLTQTTGINDRGTITGNALLPDGSNHVFVMIPCDGDGQDCRQEGEGMSADEQTAAAAWNSLMTSTRKAETPLTKLRRSLHVPGPENE
jgi:probable HAF family extracellular repeat protein